MRTMFAGSVAVAALAGLAACSAPEPANTAAATPPATTTVVTAAAPSQYVILAPSPPPKAQVEFRPPPPENAPNAVWQPGHWRWLGQSGADWQWVAGSYVIPPAGYHQWVPGQWALQTGGWAWIEGHWA